jgi:hypothetical protein
MINSGCVSDVRSGVLRFICVGCAAFTWALVVVGLGVGVLGPDCEAVPRISWMLLLSGSGRASLMSLWARQVRGDLPNRIKTVVVQASGVPGMDCRTGPGYGRGHVGVRSAPHAEMTGGSLAMAAW